MSQSFDQISRNFFSHFDEYFFLKFKSFFDPKSPLGASAGPQWTVSKPDQRYLQSKPRTRFFLTPGLSGETRESQRLLNRL